MKKIIMVLIVCGFLWTCNQPVNKSRSQPQSDEYPDSVGPVSPELKTAKKIDSVR